MPVRRYYICDNDKCNHSFDVSQAYNDDRLKKCPKCKGHSLYQDLTGMHVSVIREATTIGQLAEKNTKKMGRYELEHKMEKDGLNEQAKNREKRKKLNKLSVMTKEQKVKYINEGE